LLNLEVLAARIESERRRLAELTELGPISAEPQELLARMGHVLSELETVRDALLAERKGLTAAQRDLDALRRENEELWLDAAFAQILTDESGVIRRVNPAAERVFELSPELLSGRALSAFVATADRERFRELTAAVWRGSTDLRSWEVSLEAPRRKFVACWAAPLRPAVASKGSIRWFLQDVTVRHAHEVALDKTLNALEAQLRAESARAALLEHPKSRAAAPRERRPPRQVAPARRG
jgi:PAS domain S-box-containing protein